MRHVRAIKDDWMLAEHVADIARDVGATSIDMADTQQGAVEVAQQIRRQSSCRT